MPLNCFAIIFIQRNKRHKDTGLFAEGLEPERRLVADDEADGRRAQQEEEFEQATESVRRLVAQQEEERTQLTEV